MNLQITLCLLFFLNQRFSPSWDSQMVDVCFWGRLSARLSPRASEEQPLISVPCSLFPNPSFCFRLSGNS